MARTRTLFQHQLPTVLIPLIAVIALTPKVANGQIVPDDTLGEESSTVRQDVVKDVDSDIIEGGANRGANLFHSFSDFNVEVGRGAYFANPDTIENILSRVTGSNSSSIMGTLGVLNGDANLFLINPNGIIFGENARLDVNGSFFAATADSLLFENGFEFSGSNPQAPPLLTVNIPVGLGFRDNPGSITNQSIALDSNENPVGLKINPGENITFAAGKINLDGGIITAPGGRVELGGLSAAGTVNISENGSLTFPEGAARADVFLSNSALVNVANQGGGFINANARNLYLLGESLLLGGVAAGLNATGNPAGDINLNATGEINVSQGSSVQNRVNQGSTGNSGNIKVQADSFNLTGGGFFIASTFGKGNAGDVTIQAEGAVKLVGGNIFNTVEAGGVGDSGNMMINGQSLSLIDGSQLQTIIRQADETTPAGQGNAGNINIQVDDAVVISGLITSELQTGAIGGAGNVNIQAGSLSLNGKNNGITSSTFGKGNAGDVTIKAEGAVALISGDIFSTVEAGGVGEGGNITIKGQSLSLIDGAQLQTLVRGAKKTTLAGKGNAGDVTIKAEGAVALIGGDIFSTVESRAEGNGGEINISTSSLSLTEKAEITTKASQNGNGGNIIINARETVSLVADSNIDSSSGLGQSSAGEVNITTDSLFLGNDAFISSSTSGQGNAGNVTIEAKDTVELVEGNISSKVESRAEGNGGDIDITTNHLSLTKKAQLNTSSSGQGKAGNVTIEAEGAVELVEGEISSNVGNFDAFLSGLGNEAKGNAGDISITADSLTLEDGGSLSNSTSGEGNAGDIIINAADTVFFDNASNAQSRVEEEATGNGGNINIQARTLSLANGSEILAETFGEGKAGSIQVDVSDSVILSGFAPFPKLEDGSEGGFSSGLITGTENNAKGKGGEINVNTDRLQIADGAVLSARSRSDFPGGNITVDANTLEVTGGGQILTTAFSNGDAGTINLNISDRISLSGSDPTFFDRFNQVAEIAESGKEDAEFTIDPVSPESGIFANTKPKSTGAGGKIKIDTAQLLVSDGAQISASTDGAGKGGELTILARQGVELSGTGSEKFDEAIEESLRLRGANGDLRELLTAAPFSTATVSTGAAGTITIDTPSLVLRDGAILSSTTFGEGNAGGISILNAESVELLGSGLVAGTFNPNAEAVGGKIDIETGKLSLQDGGRILTTTFGNGEGGDVKVTASEFVELGSTPSEVILPTTINTSSVFGTGGAGNVTIDSPKLIVRDGSQIVTSSGSDSLAEPIKQGGTGGDIEVIASESVEISGTSPDGRFKSALTAESFSSSAAGNIKISSDSLTLDNNSEISAATASGEGGNIELAIADILLLENNSSITSEAKNDGNGGNIAIDADFTILKESDIIADAIKGAGGNINITTQGLFQRNSKIDASSELGVDGVVKLNTPDIDPSQGVVELPVNVQDPNKLIAQDACKQGIGSSLVVTGRGGLPPSDNQSFNSNWVDVDLIQPLPPEDQSSLESDREANSVPSADAVSQDRLIPAEGWVVNEQGEIFLVAYKSSNANSQRQNNRDHCQPK